MNKQPLPPLRQGGPRRPVLDEPRLQEMQARASNVWRGLLQPKTQCAEDVLYLIAEVRTLRVKLMEAAKPGDKLPDFPPFPEFPGATKKATQTESKDTSWKGRFVTLRKYIRTKL